MYRFQQGCVPVLVSFPHSSTFLPEEVAAAMTDHGRAVPDTDWFLPRLYDFVPGLGVSVIEARFSRYVIDANRPPDGRNLYPGQPTPELCPLQTFAGESIWLPDHAPDPFETGRRIREYWTPYHDQIQQELDRMRHEYGKAVLFDAHSIRSRVPRLFEGLLPDINIGTANGESCSPELHDSVRRYLEGQSGFTHVINGRFVGGYITRHYGKPAKHVHAIQLELSQRRYMNEESGRWLDEEAIATTELLRGVLETIIDWTGYKRD